MILIVFGILYGAISLLVKYHDTKNNLNEIRCDPMFIPFAGIFGVDSEENSTFCMKHIQKKNIEEHMHETKHKTKNIEKVGNDLGNSVSSVKSSISGIKGLTGGLFSGITSMMINTIIKFQNMLYHLKTLTGKLSATGKLFVNITQTGVKAGGSIVNGPVVKTLKALCFDPDTVLQLKTGEEVTMKNTKIGDSLINGSVIIGKVDIRNQHDEVFYAIENGKHTILVTGTHLIFDESIKRYRKVEEAPISKKTNIKKDMFHCLIMDDNIIKIGEHTFWDYDD
jgi:hypothetical protein